MARRLFFVEQVRNGRAEISGEDAGHLTKVLRVEAGQKYELSDNRNLYLAEVELARRQQVVFRILEKFDSPEPSVHLHLCAALIKFDHFELMLEKATELGVERVTPVIAERSEKGLEQGALKRMDRWKRILRESCQQSRRAQLPSLDPPATLRSLLGFAATQRFFLDEAEKANPILAMLPDHRDSKDAVMLLVGPEGGWADHERTAVIEAQWQSVSLGPSILRAETAAVAALSILSAAWQPGVLSDGVRRDRTLVANEEGSM